MNFRVHRCAKFQFLKLFYCLTLGDCEFEYLAILKFEYYDRNLNNWNLKTVYIFKILSHYDMNCTIYDVYSVMLREHQLTEIFSKIEFSY